MECYIIQVVMVVVVVVVGKLGYLERGMLWRVRLGWRGKGLSSNGSGNNQSE